MTFNDVMNEIFDTGAEYIREDWDNDCNTVITEYHGNVVLYDKGSNISIGSYCITQNALNAKYKCVQKFSKKNLKSGMIVKLRNGKYKLVIDYSSKSYLSQDANNLFIFGFIDTDDTWYGIGGYFDNLTCNGYSSADIVEVFTNIPSYCFSHCLRAKSFEDLEQILHSNNIKKISISK